MTKQYLAAASILMLSLSCLSFAQTHKHIPPAVEGAKHPDQVPDDRAWLAQLIASTSSQKDSADTQAHALLHRRHMGLADGAAVLVDFRKQFDALTTHYNQGKLGGQAQLDTEHAIDVLI